LRESPPVARAHRRAAPSRDEGDTTRLDGSISWRWIRALPRTAMPPGEPPGGPAYPHPWETRRELLT